MEDPGYLSPEWSDYVMTQFAEGELIDGKPVLVGLRRVGRMLLGEVKESYGECIASDFDLNNKRCNAVVNYTLVFDEGKRVSGMAEVNPFNTDDMFLGFPVATAESRAESRAWKKALMLRGLTFDEIPKDKDVKEQVKSIFGTDGSINNEGVITEKQKIVIERNCGLAGIDLVSFINSNKNYGPYSNISEVEKDVAAKMINKLTKYVNGEEEVPENIKEKV